MCKNRDYGSAARIRGAERLRSEEACARAFWCADAARVDWRGELEGCMAGRGQGQGSSAASDGGTREAHNVRSGGQFCATLLCGLIEQGGFAKETGKHVGSPRRLWCAPGFGTTSGTEVMAVRRREPGRRMGT